jgi:hypothetical protein
MELSLPWSLGPHTAVTSAWQSRRLSVWHERRRKAIRFNIIQWCISRWQCHCSH